MWWRQYATDIFKQTFEKIKCTNFCYSDDSNLFSEFIQKLIFLIISNNIQNRYRHKSYANKKYILQLSNLFNKKASVKKRK